MFRGFQYLIDCEKLPGYSIAMVYALRGAIVVPGNDASSISAASVRLMDEIIIQNRLRPKNIISIFFSVTKNLTAVNPATTFRIERGYSKTPLFTVQEAIFENSLDNVIRVLVHIRKLFARKQKNVYLDGAEKLRPDLDTN